MRVAMVSEHASPLAVLGGADAGGQNVHVAALATQLAKRGADVVVYTRRDDPALPHRVHLATGVVVEHVDAGPPCAVGKDDLLPHMDAFAERLVGAWRADLPDFFHSHFWMSGRASLAAARQVPVPLVHTFHALGSVKRRQQGAKDTSPPMRVAEECRIARRADRVICTSKDELGELVRMGAPASRMFTVPCGVDLTLFSPQGPAWPRRPGVARLVIVSRFVERKGIGNAISAVADVPGAELLIAGGPERARLASDPEARRLQQLAHRAGVGDRLHFLGRGDRRALPGLLRSADVAVSVPWYEPFGIVPLEAMACGVPVVASAVGGMIETVVDGVTGVHVPPRRPEVIASATRSLLADERLRRALGRNGARWARERYGWGRVAAATLDVYEGVLTGLAAPRRGAVG
ncbi:glycosyltransferase family 1 protein [soil metagenome]